MANIGTEYADNIYFWHMLTTLKIMEQYLLVKIGLK
jgi:hypothetical protein